MQQSQIIYRGLMRVHMIKYPAEHKVLRGKGSRLLRGIPFFADKFWAGGSSYGL